MNTDPFGTETLRKAALDAWRASPTRFREDANAEEDLVLGGYRDRWFVELAQNAADAAARAGRDGVLRLSIVDNELLVANTGVPLDTPGVAALASLRASAKRDGPAKGSEAAKRGGEAVGRFGVGFAAVLPISREPRVVSTTGGVRFSGADTRRLVADDAALRAEVADRGGRVPVLRLVWPTDAGEPVPPDGFDTEVRLPLEPAVDKATLLAVAEAQAADVLLAFPALHRIELPGRVISREDAGAGVAVLHDGARATRWLLIRRHGELPTELRAAAEEHHRPEWTVCWAVVVPASDGAPRPADADVLHGPTPTDERLSLPARLLATLPVEPSRRRIRPGAAADFVLAQAIRCYPELVAAVAPEHRTRLVPRAGFPLSEVDSLLRDGLLAVLRTIQWLPAAGGGEVSPAGARVLDAGSPVLTELLADLVPGLLAAELSQPVHAAALAQLNVPRLGLADVVSAVSGVDRPVAWWLRLYEALTPLADAGPMAREELAALPVPLLDGRTVTGPRSTVVFADTVVLESPVLESPVLGSPVLERPIDVPGLRVVHPDAVHPLLTRLGAQPAGPRELLTGPALRAAVERSVDDAEAGLDTSRLADTVLRLVGSLPAGERLEWLGALALPAADGELRRADELVLPDGALRAVLAAGSPVGVLRDDVAAAHPRSALRAVGVLDGFAVVTDEAPAGPDHELADEQQWWAGLAEPPRRLVAVRDLDLVDDDAWPGALRLLAADPETARALHATPSYTSWWLARHARLAGRAPRHWRLPSAVELAGLYDPVPIEGLGEQLLAAAGVRAALTVLDADDAVDLLARLADSAREPTPATVLAAHAALAGALAGELLDIDDVEPPQRVRALTGAVVAAADAVVLDQPWLAGVVAADRLVAGGDPAVLAELLDLPLASEQLAGQVVSTGRLTAWARLPEVAAACQALRRAVPAGSFVEHENLRVRAADGTEHPVPYWVEADGTVHAADPLRALIFVG